MTIRDLALKWLGLAEPETPAERVIILDESQDRVGYSGQEYSDGEFGWQQGQGEHVTELKDWEDRVARFEKMRRGRAPIAAALESLLEPILSGTWSIEAGVGLSEELGGKPVDPEMAERAAEFQRANLLRSSAAREYRMGRTFKQLLSECFNAQPFGVSVFETTKRIVEDGPLGTRAAYDGIHWIHPVSIEGWQVDENGVLLGIEQQVDRGWYEDGGIGAKQHKIGDRRFIPASRLFVVTRRQEGDDPTGNSMLRPMHGTDKRSAFLERIQIVDAQKRGVAVPVYKIGKDTDPEIQAKAIQQVKSMRGGANERSYLVMQGDDEVKFMDMTANTPDFESMLRSQRGDIASVAGTEFKRLGSEGSGGSRAVGETQAPHFALHIEAVADTIREAIQLQLIEPLHELNFGPDVPPPVLRVSDVVPPNDGPLIAAVGGGLLTWRPEDEQDYRKTRKLIPLDLDAAESDEEADVDEPVEEPDEGEEGVERERVASRGSGGEATADPTSTLNGAQIASMLTIVQETAAGNLDKRTAKELILVSFPLSGARVDAVLRHVEEGDIAPRAAVGDDPTTKTPTSSGAPVPAKAKDEDLPADPMADEAKPADDPEAQLSEHDAYWREPTQRESAFIRLSEINAKFSDFADDFLAVVRPLHDQAVLEATSKLTVAQSGEVRIPKLRRKALTKAHEDAASAMRAYGDETVTMEIRRQRTLMDGDASVLLADGIGDLLDAAGDPAQATALLGRQVIADRVTGELATAIELNVDDILDSIIKGVRRGFMDGLREGMNDTNALASAQRGALSKSNAMFERAGRDLASRSFNGGRAEGVAEAREADIQVETAIRTEILDSATCSECRRLDGKVVRVDSEDYFEYMPPNKCLGGSFCRGFYDFVVTEETPTP